MHLCKTNKYSTHARNLSPATERSIHGYRNDVELRLPTSKKAESEDGEDCLSKTLYKLISWHVIGMVHTWIGYGDQLLWMVCKMSIQVLYRCDGIAQCLQNKFNNIAWFRLCLQSVIVDASAITVIDCGRNGSDSLIKVDQDACSYSRLIGQRTKDRNIFASHCTSYCARTPSQQSCIRNESSTQKFKNDRFGHENCCSFLFDANACCQTTRSVWRLGKLRLIRAAPARTFLYFFFKKESCQYSSFISTMEYP